MEMAKRVVRYVKNARNKGVFYPYNNTLILTAYCDADWGACPTTRKSTTGFVTLLGDAPLTWRSKKQPTVSLSSAEAEYKAMAMVTKEIVWLTHILQDMFVEVPRPITLHCDNKSAIHIATNPVFHERTKHIEIDCHFVRKKYDERLLVFKYVPSQSQLADIFTKGLGTDQFYVILKSLGFGNTYSIT